jgi:hypothetical protein
MARMRISRENLKVSLLVFNGSEAIGEYPLKIKQVATDDAIREVFSKLKPEYSAVVLGPNGTYCQRPISRRTIPGIER